MQYVLHYTLFAPDSSKRAAVITACCQTDKNCADRLDFNDKNDIIMQKQ